MKKDMPLEGLRWSRDSGSALYDTPPKRPFSDGLGGANNRRKLGFFIQNQLGNWQKTAKI